jgi:carboxylesterase type B
MRQSLLAIFLSAAFADAQGAFRIGQGVKTTSGTILGQASTWKKEVSEYLGVPFALPPTGNLRWAAPQAIKDGSKSINATQYVCHGSSNIEVTTNFYPRERKLSNCGVKKHILI